MPSCSTARVATERLSAPSRPLAATATIAGTTTTPSAQGGAINPVTKAAAPRLKTKGELTPPVTPTMAEHTPSSTPTLNSAGHWRRASVDPDMSRWRGQTVRTTPNTTKTVAAATEE